jgi:hypothetical protein
MTSDPEKSRPSKGKPKSKTAKSKAKASAVSEDDLAHEPPFIAARIRRIRACKPINEQTLIEPLWVAESIVRECGVWLGEDLPEQWPALLAVKADKCFAAHPQFHRLIKAPENGIFNLRKFMRHWLSSLIQRKSLELYKRLPYEYNYGRPPPSRRPEASDR